MSSFKQKTKKKKSIQMHQMMLFKKVNHFAAYDISEIYPFQIYNTVADDTLEKIANKTGCEISLISDLNQIDKSKKLQKELLIHDGDNNFDKLRSLNVGDLINFDMDEAMLKIDPKIILLQYHTCKKMVLGRFMITEYEIMFEPLNENLKGMVDQLSCLKS